MPLAVSRSIRVLVVDDHSVVRTGLRLIIQGSPGLAIVGEAANRDEALALAARERPDVILLDLDLGGESGVALISDLLGAAAEARVIILTGLRDPEVYRKAVMVGAMGVVKKENAAEVLIKAIERIHAGEAWLDPSIMAGVLNEMSGTSKKRDREAEKIATLTNREREVVALVGEGIKNKEVAGRLFISETTVRHHLTSIFDKLEVSDRVELLLYAMRHGLASPR
ncbi:MAG TPA: response regulator transcription factor [Blastocatellia bacterium]|nr:response regulator transcription factor [Blastocatellia bacterium]